MKKLAKAIIVKKLGKKIKKLRAKNNFKVIAVGGSLGKTSTKLAIATVLKEKYRVQYQDGNYNDIVSVPLIFFGLPMPSLFNPLAWLATFIKIHIRLSKPYPYNFVIVEVGTDGPGQIEEFREILTADLGVLTAIAPEHMEFFDTIVDVANEELGLATFSSTLLVNDDLCDTAYLNKVNVPLLTYAKDVTANYQITNVVYHPNGYEFDILKDSNPLLHSDHDSIAESQLYSICAAAAVSDWAGLSTEEIDKGIHKLQPVSGRMQHLRGINKSTIIDDTYNASPVAVKGALDTLYKIEAPQKIALLGNMNELGIYSPEAHIEIGKYCDSRQLNLVVTIGPEANRYLAPAAKDKGCNVQTFRDPYSAGEFIKQKIKEGSVILAKGSQNDVFAEEAVKILLADPKDASKLVRQSKRWLAIKHKNFRQ